MWIEELERLLEASDESADRYLQLATVDKNGNPQNRTLVFRGFDKTQSSLLMSTDLRSPKVKEVEENPRASICWYVSSARIQFRLECEVVVLRNSEDEIRQKQWESHSKNARRLFFEPEPGSMSEKRSVAEISKDQLESEHPPETFGVLKCVPDVVDVLDLNSTPHKRERWTRSSDGEWNSVLVNP